MPKTFVLLHGAWHGGWCWDRVAAPLRARGHRVTTPTQTGLGERAHLISDKITLETFTDDLVNHILFEDLRDVVLVGHSFGGNAISGAAERVPERIAELVYLDATVIGPGECPFDLMPEEVATERRRLAQQSSGGVSIPCPPASAFGVLDPIDARWLEARLTPHPISTMESRIPITGAPGATLPKRYIACVDPIYPALQQVRDRVAAAGWQVDELRTGHNAMVSAPDALTDLLGP